jgi:hypothetical protein
LIRERKGFQLHPEYETDPSVYFIDGKIGRPEVETAQPETVEEKAPEPALEPVGGVR